MVVNNQKSLAQNILRKAHLAASIIDDSSINSNDIVYEIGPGTGVLTKELARKAKQVVAIEKDCHQYLKLKKKFEFTRNVVLYNADFLKFRIREPCYKVFANVPFNITSAVIRKMLYTPNPPMEAYLLVQKEAAGKFVGAAKTTQFSVMVKPWFSLRITRSFKRTDFAPVPQVDVVMLHLEKRIRSLIAPADLRLYESFIRRGFGAWRRNLKLNYRHVFSHTQWKRLSRDFGFHIRARPSELQFGQWLGLFEFFRENVCRS